jgi:hemerythrin-like domain-containing protein
MTIKITDALVGEHGPLYAQLDRLATVTDGSVDAIQSCAQLLAAGLASHARLEDELLFAALEQRTGRDSLLEDMYEDHEQVDALLSELARVDDPEQARSLAARLVALARNHFAKEEKAVFPLAEQVLGDAELVRLGEDWEYRRLDTPFTLEANRQ